MSTYKDRATAYCRVLLPAEWSTIRDMRLAALSESPQAFLGEFDEEMTYQEDDWRKTFESASWHCSFLATGSPVGIAKSSVLTEHPEERYIESFWVSPEYRNQHVAQLIVQSIIDEARVEGRSCIRLSVLRTNLRAIRAVGHLGFSKIVAARSGENEICLELPLA